MSVLRNIAALLLDLIGQGIDRHVCAFPRLTDDEEQA